MTKTCVCFILQNGLMASWGYEDYNTHKLSHKPSTIFQKKSKHPPHFPIPHIINLPLKEGFNDFQNANSDEIGAGNYCKNKEFIHIIKIFLWHSYML